MKLLLVTWLLVEMLAVSCWATAPLRVVLDFFPNPNHVPLYVAQELRMFDDEGVEVDLIVPANPSDPPLLAAARSFEIALTPQINYLIARSEGLPLMAIGALIDAPLGGLLAISGCGIDALADLRGQRVGYALAPLEPILWGTMLGSAGVREDEVDLINVGFNTMVALVSGHVEAIGAFRNYERIQLELLGHEPVFFPQEAYGVPDTYDLLIVGHPETLASRDAQVGGFLRALSQAIMFTRANPDEAYRHFLHANPDLDDELNRRAFGETLALFAGGVRHDDDALWDALQAYLASRGLIAGTWPLDQLYTAAWLPEPLEAEAESGED